MIKRWIDFINEGVINPDSFLDMKMQEMKDMLTSLGNETLIYEWENKNDHHLYVNFSVNGLTVRYEFDIDEMLVTKTVGETVDFSNDVESLEQGVSTIQKDINSIIGISK